jgi:hypothetical protein
MAMFHVPMSRLPGRLAGTIPSSAWARSARIARVAAGGLVRSGAGVAIAGMPDDRPIR